MAVKRKDGRWQAQVRHAGRRYTFYGSSRADADGGAAEFSRRVRETAQPMLADWLPEWLAGKNLAPSTEACYGLLIRKYLKEALPLDSLRTEDCQRLVRQAPLGTQRKLHAVLRAALNDAVRQGRLSTNPARLVHVPPYVPRGNPLDPQDAQRMLEAARPLEPLFRTALGTGLRHGELLNLRAGDVREDRLEVRSSKTRAGIRTVPIPASLRAWLPIRRRDQFLFLFCTAHETPLGGETSPSLSHRAAWTITAERHLCRVRC